MTAVEHAGHEAAHDPHEGHPTDLTYIKVALFLAFITAAEVAVSYTDIDAIAQIALLIPMMVVKFATVVSYFMHLKFDNKLFTYVFYMGLLLAFGVYLGALTTFHFWNK